MRLILALAGSAIILMGCATTQRNKAPSEPIDVGPTPVCSSTDECQAMWAKATTVLPMITGMRLAMMNDIYMETYPAIRGVPLHAKATKNPLGNGKYEISATITCRHSGVCGDLPENGLRLFNTSVNNAGLAFRPISK
jgi:hypothetical protein